jgi:hypothetical protein
VLIVFAVQDLRKAKKENPTTIVGIVAKNKKIKKGKRDLALGAATTALGITLGLINMLLEKGIRERERQENERRERAQRERHRSNTPRFYEMPQGEPFSFRPFPPYKTRASQDSDAFLAQYEATEWWDEITPQPNAVADENETSNPETDCPVCFDKKEAGEHVSAFDCTPNAKGEKHWLCEGCLQTMRNYNRTLECPECRATETLRPNNFRPFNSQYDW